MKSPQHFIDNLLKFNDFGETENGQIAVGDSSYPQFVNEFWTSRQRQANALHEVAYRACFKGQLPRFFIERLTQPGDVVATRSADVARLPSKQCLLNRNVIANDINPLSALLAEPRLSPPELPALQQRLAEIRRFVCKVRYRFVDVFSPANRSGNCFAAKLFDRPPGKRQRRCDGSPDKNGATNSASPGIRRDFFGINVTAQSGGDA
ncbi:MAG: hypothetical protein R3C26_19870 [Calditrichia bacterium]